MMYYDVLWTSILHAAKPERILTPFFLHFFHFIVKEKNLICWTPGEPKRSPTNLCPALPDSPCAIWWSLDKISQTAHTQTHRHTGSRDIPCMETQLVTGVLSKANTCTNSFLQKNPRSLLHDPTKPWQSKTHLCQSAFAGGLRMFFESRYDSPVVFI
jgi:hypothetical protein